MMRFSSPPGGQINIRETEQKKLECDGKTEKKRN